MNKYRKKIFAAILIFWISFSFGKIVFDPTHHYLRGYFNQNVYKNLENLYVNSQYRKEHPTSIIADEIVFRYASVSYVRGEDPIRINSEHTPLGKYLVGVSFLWFQTEVAAILFSGILALIALWFLGKQVLKDGVWSLIPAALFVAEPLFQNQIRVTPLLDIIQLPWILLSLIFFLKEQFFFTALSLGFVMATKSIVPAFLLITSFLLFLGLRKKWEILKHFLMWLPLGFVVLIVSYAKTFQNGYTFSEFIGFQKWIILYQQSKLIFPFSFWRLTLLNQWQTWWGEMKVMPVEDWWLTWPILVVLPILLLVWRKKKLSDPALLLVLWAIVYEAFLSLGVVSTRFLLPLLPALYILLLYTFVKI